MIFFAHLGIGSAMTRPIRKRMRVCPWKFVLLGCVMSDLIDKPLYYSLSFATGRQGADLGLFCGTRTLGHTVLLAATIALAGRMRKAPALFALSTGMFTHLLLDALFDPTPGYLLWPITPFPVHPFHSVREHLLSWARLRFLFAEFLGALLLFWEFRHPISQNGPTVAKAHLAD